MNISFFIHKFSIELATKECFSALSNILSIHLWDNSLTFWYKFSCFNLNFFFLIFHFFFCFRYMLLRLKLWKHFTIIYTLCWYISCWFVLVGLQHLIKFKNWIETKSLKFFYEFHFLLHNFFWVDVKQRCCEWMYEQFFPREYETPKKIFILKQYHISRKKKKFFIPKV